MDHTETFDFKVASIRVSAWEQIASKPGAGTHITVSPKDFIDLLRIGTGALALAGPDPVGDIDPTWLSFVLEGLISTAAASKTALTMSRKDLLDATTMCHQAIALASPVTPEPTAETDPA